MSHQLSECPNCNRAFLGSGSRSGRCRVCGTPLIEADGEKEADVHDRLYGRRDSQTRVNGSAGPKEPAR
jgi:hypothetical protein